MKSTTILNLRSLNDDLNSALTSSIFNLQRTNSDVDFWAATSLQNNVKSVLTTNASSMTDNVQNNPIDMSGNGFTLKLGLQILIGYKVRYKGNISMGYRHNSGNFSGSTSLNLSMQNTDLKTGMLRREPIIDISAAINLTVGSENSKPVHSLVRTLDSPISVNPQTGNHFSYGGLFSWNSDKSDGRLSLDTIQRDSIFNLQLGNSNMKSGSDSANLSFTARNTNKLWKGSLSVFTPIMDIGFQEFKTDFAYLEKEKEHKMMRSKLKKLKDEIERNGTLSEMEKKNQLDVVKKALKELSLMTFQHQSSYKLNLDKASTFIKLNKKSGTDATLEIEGPEWLESILNKKIVLNSFDSSHEKIY